MQRREWISLTTYVLKRSIWSELNRCEADNDARTLLFLQFVHIRNYRDLSLVSLCGLNDQVEGIAIQ